VPGCRRGGAERPRSGPAHRRDRRDRRRPLGPGGCACTASGSRPSGWPPTQTTCTAPTPLPGASTPATPSPCPAATTSTVATACGTPSTDVPGCSTASACPPPDAGPDRTGRPAPPAAARPAGRRLRAGVGPVRWSGLRGGAALSGRGPAGGELVAQPPAVADLAPAGQIGAGPGPGKAGRRAVAGAVRAGGAAAGHRPDPGRLLSRLAGAGDRRDLSGCG